MGVLDTHLETDSTSLRFFGLEAGHQQVEDGEGGCAFVFEGRGLFV
ncbi:hypothetical protein [Alkalilimnicola ehrlichii]|nr:hypothetical protein [Alkalilimnicola ehrlichii]